MNTNEETAIEFISKMFPKQVKADALLNRINRGEYPKIVLKYTSGNTECPIVTCHFKDTHAVFVIDKEGTAIEVLDFVRDFDFSDTTAYCHRASVIPPHYYQNIEAEVVITL